MSGGKGRDWGYGSYDVDGDDNYDESKLGYTSYEQSGKANRYQNNGDGGHSHAHWNNKDDYNKGTNPDQERIESGKRENPSIGEIQDKGNCYLTTACMKHYLNEFDDNCYELRVLRWFRDNFVNFEDVEHYYKTAPYIVEGINNEKHSDIMYDYIYDNIVDYCVEKIENLEFEEAYKRYKSSMINFEHLYDEKPLGKKIIKTFNK